VCVRPRVQLSRWIPTIDDRRADGIRGFDDDPVMDPPEGGGTGPGNNGGGGGFLSNRRIKLTAVFPMIGGTRRTISKSDSSSLAKTSNSERSMINAAAATAKPPISLPRNRMRRGSSLTDLKRSDSLAGTSSHIVTIIFWPKPTRLLCSSGRFRWVSYFENLFTGT